MHMAEGISWVAVSAPSHHPYPMGLVPNKATLLVVRHGHASKVQAIALKASTGRKYQRTRHQARTTTDRQTERADRLQLQSAGANTTNTITNTTDTSTISLLVGKQLATTTLKVFGFSVTCCMDAFTFPEPPIGPVARAATLHRALNYCLLHATNVAIQSSNSVWEGGKALTIQQLLPVTTLILGLSKLATGL